MFTALISSPSVRDAEIKNFLGTSNSSKETRARAKDLANDIGCYHIDLNMDAIASAFTSLFTSLFPLKKLRFKSQGGSNQENLGLQNIQSRSRMVLSYLLASTLTWVRDRRNGGNLLVLGSANVDECLRGMCLSKQIFPDSIPLSRHASGVVWPFDFPKAVSLLEQLLRSRDADLEISTGYLVCISRVRILKQKLSLETCLWAAMF